MKIIITGTSGFLGKRLAQHFQRNHECITPTHKELDITDASSCMELLTRHTPNYVFHAAAISDMGECEKDPLLSYQVNVLGTENLAKACRKTKSRMFFMSSDQVYNGNHAVGGNNETDLCNPANVYGRQKLEAEQRLFAIIPDALALRLTWMYDLPTTELDTKDNFLTNILNAVNKNQPITCSDKDYRGITYVKEVVKNIGLLLRKPGGIYNFGSYGTESTYELAREVFSMVHKDEKAGLFIKRNENAYPRNLVMNQERLNRQKINFASNREGIIRCLKDYKHL